MDMYDAFPEKKEDEPKKASRHGAAAANGAPEAPRVAGAGSRKVAPPADDGRPSTSQPASKDHQLTASGPTSAPSAAAAPAVSSKKRKAAAQSGTSAAPSPAAATTGTAQGAPSSSTTTRRSNATGANTAAVPSVTTALTGSAGSGYKETNLLSFENCGARPTNGLMIADDGTILQRNGKIGLLHTPSFPSPAVLTLP